MVHFDTIPTMVNDPSPRGAYESLSDEAISKMIRDLHDEQRRRMAEAGDFVSMCERGFVEGFDSKGHAKEPVLKDGLLVCYGSILEKSTMSHDCTFVHIGENWVWEHPETLHDEVRKKPERGREHQRSVSIVSGLEGLEYDLISCRMRNNVHQMHTIRSYRIVDGRVELVAGRTVAVERYR
jgi:hypothetical protein